MPKTAAINSTETSATSRKTAYHHGALRQALIDRGLQLLEEHGATALSLRFVSRELGVSQTAPYHHFADKRALLGALAADGFRQLTAALLLEPSREKTFNRHIKSLCAGLMHFASEKPELFKLMYSGQLTPIEGHDEVMDAASENYHIFVNRVGETLRKFGVNQVDPSYAAMTIFAMGYGVSNFVICQRLTTEAQALVGDGKEFVRHAADFLAAGLLAHSNGAVKWPDAVR